MHKYKVLKDFTNPWGTPIEANPEGLVAGNFVSVDFSDEELADPKVGPAIEALIADGSIELIPAVFVDYVVMTQLGVLNDANETFQKGNVIQFEQGSLEAQALVTEGDIMLKSDFDALPVDESAPSTITTPNATGIDPNAEPRKRYRGQIVMHESKRTVGTQTFNHIAIADGSELDLTDKEYAGEVHVSYPTQK